MNSSLKANEMLVMSLSIKTTPEEQNQARQISKFTF